MKILLLTLLLIPFLSYSQNNLPFKDNNHRVDILVSYENIYPWAGISHYDVSTGWSIVAIHKGCFIKQSTYFGVQLRDRFKKHTTQFTEIGYRHYEESIPNLYWLASLGVGLFDETDMAPVIGVGVGWHGKKLDVNISNRFIYRDNVGAGISISVGYYLPFKRIY